MQSVLVGRGARGGILLFKTCSVLVAAAGRGRRAGLPYPKTLYPVRNRPILVRILETLLHLDPSPTVIVSPTGRTAISQCLDRFRVVAHLVEQAEAKGMGDAVLCFAKSESYGISANVLLIWGDIPFIQRTTVDRMIAAHLAGGNDFTFVTARVQSAYTKVQRNEGGEVTGVAECRELGLTPTPGEREIGLFIFRRDPVLEALQQDAPGKFGETTGEHGFLYVVGLLASGGRKVVGLPIATKRDLVSLNSISDLGEYA